jgi:peptide/nickel transport system permease protein
VLLVFFLFKAFGGDPAEILGGLNATPEQIIAIRSQLGLNQPVWVQLGIFLKQIVSFDWGRAGPPTRRWPTCSPRGCRPR